MREAIATLERTLIKVSDVKNKFHFNMSMNTSLIRSQKMSFCYRKSCWQNKIISTA